MTNILVTFLFILSFATGRPTDELARTFEGAKSGTATVFWSKGDSGNPNNHNACYRRAPGVTKVLDDHQLVFAHKTLPCGSYALLYNPRTRLWVRARKVDWGPRHAMVDVSRAVARKLRLNGKEEVLLIPLPEE